MKVNSQIGLKVLSWVSALFASTLWVIFYVRFFSGGESGQWLDFLLHNFNVATYPLFCVFSVILLLRANLNRGVLYFSFFLSQIAINIALGYLHRGRTGAEFEIYSALTFVTTSFAYIKSFQHFPQQIGQEDLRHAFSRSRILRGYTSFFLTWKAWVVFPLVIAVLAFLFPGSMKMRFSVNLAVLFTANLFLYVNFRISSPSSRNRIRWLVWGVLCYTFLTLLAAILTYSDEGGYKNLEALFKMLRALSLFVSVTMCLFFFDTFDTGVLIKRTIVDGMIFILIVLLYNTIEHYFLHWLTHTLHISNTLVSSVLSGFFVLIFSPVHHKFMHLLDGRFKKKGAEGGHHDAG